MVELQFGHRSEFFSLPASEKWCIWVYRLRLSRSDDDGSPVRHIFYFQASCGEDIILNIDSERLVNLGHLMLHNFFLHFVRDHIWMLHTHRKYGSILT
jgi:hypothetical protein